MSERCLYDVFKMSFRRACCLGKDIQLKNNKKVNRNNNEY